MYVNILLVKLEEQVLGLKSPLFQSIVRREEHKPVCLKPDL